MDRGGMRIGVRVESGMRWDDSVVKLGKGRGES